MNGLIPYDDLPEFLTPAEFREHVRVSRNTAYEMIRRGEVPHVRFGRLIRIPKVVLRELAECGHHSR